MNKDKIIKTYEFSKFLLDVAENSETQHLISVPNSSYIRELLKQIKLDCESFNFQTNAKAKIDGNVISIPFCNKEGQDIIVKRIIILPHKRSNSFKSLRGLGPIGVWLNLDYSTTNPHFSIEAKSRMLISENPVTIICNNLEQ